MSPIDAATLMINLLAGLSGVIVLLLVVLLVRQERQSKNSGVAGETVADVRERLGILIEATRKLEAVGETVTDVQHLLQVPKLRGVLGEVWLEELLHQVFPDSLYQMQYGFKTGEVVDAVLHVGERLVPIDAKFPLEACHRMIEAEGDERSKYARQFHRSMRARIDEIASKYIKPDENTYDFAIMYVPAENVFYEAIKHGVLDTSSAASYALSKKVIMVSPNTLYAYLTAVMQGLKGLEVEKHAQEILKSLGGLQGRFERFERNFELVGKHLNNAARQYSESEQQIRAVTIDFDRLTNFEEG